jgi:hypothetical protein
MSEYVTGSAITSLVPPSGEKSFSSAVFRGAAKARSVGDIVMGVADVTVHERALSKNGIAYVDVNNAGRLLLGAEQEGLVATGGLCGCTGVAGFAAYEDGSAVQLISHYDSNVQAMRLAAQDNSIVDQLSSFKRGVE